MPEQFLHRADIITIFQKVGGKAVAKVMATAMLCYTPAPRTGP